MAIVSRITLCIRLVIGNIVDRPGENLADRQEENIACSERKNGATVTALAALHQSSSGAKGSGTTWQRVDVYKLR